MQVQVLLEPIEGGRFRASSNLFGFIAEGATEEEATTNYRDAVAARLLNGGKFVSVDVPDSKLSVTNHPWMKFAGTLPDDDLTQEWKEAMEEYRRVIDDPAQ